MARRLAVKVSRTKTRRLLAEPRQEIYDRFIREEFTGRDQKLARDFFSERRTGHEDKPSCAVVIQQKPSCGGHLEDRLSFVMCQTWHRKPVRPEDGRDLAQIYGDELRATWAAFKAECNLKYLRKRRG